MSRVVIGYGKYKGYKVTELPESELLALARRFPLTLDPQCSPEYEELLITLATHAELKRREAGGKPAQHLPTQRELAGEIIAKGYQQASKNYHPDTTGHHEAQVRLTQVRDDLLHLCNELPDDNHDEGTTVIPAPQPPAPPARPTPAWGGVPDDDVPF